ncbi:hypothetical protein [Paracraurococcus lichenis]|uniref:Uncharacterized protein n=1 Tax=Paracraurococcus lichenis TaxID=3064888 RepID=A0ABT9E120_9PROT|nr:hypothetical protein [Paracraurococcus sp. LOR1-02]MDO9709862.1 hypothetical protein [Paracraurococcus sp. LOR1-02]
MSLIHNERLKLQVNALDRASTACLAAGVLGPTVGQQTSPTTFLWLLAAAGLHMVAYRMLGRLQAP